MELAIRLDQATQPDGAERSYAKRWLELAEQRGIATRRIDVFSDQVFDQISGCDGLMWRFGYDKRSLRFARLLLNAVEQGMGIPVFPNHATRWHFEDKISQHYLFNSAGIPCPKTWVFWSFPDAAEFCEKATYPLVAKLTSGIRGSNVVLLRDKVEAFRLLNQLFGSGITQLEKRPPNWPAPLLARKAALEMAVKPYLEEPVHQGYFYVQEFVPGNDFDTRVIVIGQRAFAFRRMNRENDFRASGSGKRCWDRDKIDPGALRLAFRTARRVGAQTMAMDIVKHGDTHLILEVSYTSPAWSIAACPGHWELRGDPESGEMEWVEGQVFAEDAIFDDFVRLVESRQARPTLVAALVAG